MGECRVDVTGLRRALRGEFEGTLPGRTVASCASRPPPLCSSREGASTVVLGFLRFHRVRILAPRPCCSSSSPSGRRAGASKMDCSVSRCCATRCRDSSGSGYRSWRLCCPATASAATSSTDSLPYHHAPAPRPSDGEHLPQWIFFEVCVEDHAMSVLGGVHLSIVRL